MSNLQLFFAAGLPTITALVGIILTLRSTDRLEHRMEDKFDSVESRFDRVESRLDRLEADLRQFYRTLGQHDSRLDSLEKRGA